MATKKTSTAKTVKKSETKATAETTAVSKSRTNKKETEQHAKTTDIKLIITIVNRGYAEEVMTYAREAGATGGTVLHARGTSPTTITLLNINIEPEKELVLIVAHKSKCVQIMESIFKNVGLATDGAGVCFALPVETVLGFSSGLGGDTDQKLQSADK